VLANGLFVAAEFAIVAAPRASIEHQASQGSRLARSALRVLEDPKLKGRYIATTQVGISVASLGLGMYGEHWLAQEIGRGLTPLDTLGWISAHTVAGAIAVAILTYLHIVVGEMVPRRPPARFSVRPIRGIERAILPLVIALNAVGNWLLSLVGISANRSTATTITTAEDLQHRASQKRRHAARGVRTDSSRPEASAIALRVRRWCRVCCYSRRRRGGRVCAIVRSQAHTGIPSTAGTSQHRRQPAHRGSVAPSDLEPAGDGSRWARAPCPATPDQVPAAMRRFRAQTGGSAWRHGGLVTSGRSRRGHRRHRRGPRRAAILEADGRIRARHRALTAAKALGRRPMEDQNVTTVSLVLMFWTAGAAADVVLESRARKSPGCRPRRGRGRDDGDHQRSASTGCRSRFRQSTITTSSLRRSPAGR
jgi:hypothetical protein